MAERKQVNKYYPPDFDPRKHKNLDRYNNTHALRERAKKIDQGILVIRFEMPYDIWCEGCKIHIAMGVRYNAEKRKVGYYYTTPIYRFRMKCHLCENYFEIETDPKNVDYKIIIGAQRKNEKWDMAENEQVLTEDRQVVKKLGTDAMFKLEHEVEDKKKFEKAAPSLSEIVDIQSNWHDDYTQNRILRAKFRKEKKELKEKELKDKALLVKSSLDMELVPETDDDKKLASLLKYKTVESFDEKQLKRRSEIKSQSIFTSSSSSSPTSPGGEAKSAKLIKLQKQLDLNKNSNSGGFGAFDGTVRKRKANSIAGVVVKRSSGLSTNLKKSSTFDNATLSDTITDQLSTSVTTNKESDKMELSETEISEASSDATKNSSCSTPLDAAKVAAGSPSVMKSSQSESPVSDCSVESLSCSVSSPSRSIRTSSGVSPSSVSKGNNSIQFAPAREEVTKPPHSAMRTESLCGNDPCTFEKNFICSEDCGDAIQDNINAKSCSNSIKEQIKEDLSSITDGHSYSHGVSINKSFLLVGDYSNSSSESDE